MGERRAVAIHRGGARFPGVGTPIEVRQEAFDQIDVAEPAARALPVCLELGQSILDLPGAGDGRHQVAIYPVRQISLCAWVPPLDDEMLGAAINTNLLRWRYPIREVLDTHQAVPLAVALRPGRGHESSIGHGSARPVPALHSRFGLSSQGRRAHVTARTSHADHAAKILA
jgi:hypothetical protein